MKSGQKDIKFKGYSIFPHYLLLLLKEKRINVTSLGWLTIFLSLACFDQQDLGLYGSIIKTPSDIARCFKINRTTVTRQLETLVKAQLIDKALSRDGYQIYKIRHYWMLDYRAARQLAIFDFHNYAVIENMADVLDPKLTINGLENMQAKVADLLRNNAYLHSLSSIKNNNKLTSKMEGHWSPSSLRTSLSISENNNTESIKGEISEIGCAESKHFDPTCPICNGRKGIPGHICKYCAKDIDDVIAESKPIDQKRGL